MSCIYFHASDGTEAKVSGAERAMGGWYCNQLLLAAAHISPYPGEHQKAALLEIFPKDHYVHDTTQRGNFHNCVDTALHGLDNLTLQIGERQAAPFTAALNTAIVMGSDPIRLMARLHGQCEIHAYVEEENRLWLARIIQEGLETGVLRRWDYPAKLESEYGWDAAVKLLATGQGGPVVTSYSVCDQFPAACLARQAGLWEPETDEAGEENWDPWYDLPFTEQWQMCMKALRANEGYTLEMRPDNWSTYRFGDDTNGFHIREYVARRAKEMDDATRR